MAIQVHNANELKNKLSQARNKLVLIEFFATWCGPCKMMAPQLDDIAYENGGSVVVLKVDVDKCSNIADRYDVQSIPTFVFLKRSKKIRDFSGASADRIRKEIARLK